MLAMFEPQPPTAADSPTGRVVYSVARLNREVRRLLETSFPMLWVQGEISNLARPGSGHLYFTLKDEQAQVRCAMFRNRNQLLRFRPENGQQVLLRARISLYEGRGEFQLIAEQMEPAGEGDLQRAFEALKHKLAAEGLFDEARKRPLPTLPRAIGVVTSPTGAAVRDIISVLGRRFPAIPVIVYPVPVQGEGAAERIARMIGVAGARGECDVLIVGRGGGSLEDLWAFNEEVVARAIHASGIPVVSAVGHEIDFTIADFVADARAPTPSAAAELLSPDRDDWLRAVGQRRSRLEGRMRERLGHERRRLDWLGKRLQQQHPGQRLRAQAQRLDELELRLKQAWRVRLRHDSGRIATLEARLQRHLPAARIAQLHSRNEAFRQRLRTAVRTGLARRGQQLAAAARALDAVSPLNTLQRGYAIVIRGPERQVVHAAAEVAPGETVEALLARGRLRCIVEETLNE